MVNIATGRPNCNPFIPPGFPQILTPLKVGLSRVNYNCLSSASDISNAQDEAIFSPNPSSNSVQVKLSNAHQDFTVEVYSLQGQLILKTTSPTNIDISNFRSGIYVFTLKQGNNRWSTKITKK